MSEITHRVIHLDKTERLIKIPIGRSSRAVGNSRTESIDNLYFNERTVSKTHAYIEIDFNHISSQGFPSLVFMDNGSQHGVIWNGKRLPKHTKFSLKNNEHVGLVDLLKKHQPSVSSFVEKDDPVIDFDTVYYFPDQSWQMASVKHSKIKLQIEIVKHDADHFDLVVDKINHSSNNDGHLSKAQAYDGSANSIIEEDFDKQNQSDDADEGFDNDIELYETEFESNKTMEIPDFSEEESLIIDDESIQFSDSDISGAEVDDLYRSNLKRKFDEVDEPSEAQFGNVTKSIVDEDETNQDVCDEVCDYDAVEGCDTEKVDKGHQYDINLQSSKISELDMSSSEPPAKKQKVPVNQKITLHLLSGFAGVIFGAGLTFIGLASLGESLIETSV